MLRFLFAFLMFIHGFIHLMGFVREWQLAEIGQLTGKTLLPLSGNMAKLVGVGWLVACLVFLGAAVGFLLKKDWWWMAAAMGLVLSQLLIILYWPDAKAGTLVNIIILFITIPAAADWSFERQSEREREAILTSATAKTPEVITTERLAGLPEPVQRWLKRAGVVGKSMPQVVRLKQKGLIRTAADREWMPAEAEQVFTIDPPGFLWKTRVQMMPLLHFGGRDRYFQGKGRMLIKLLSLAPVVDASGPEIDQGTLQRYLGEIVWFPAAALSPYIEWEAVDANRAKGTLTYRGVSGSGIFEIDEQGDFVSFRAERFMGGDKGATLEDWYIPARAWSAPGGVRIPVKGDVIWELEDGDFNYYQWEITGIEYE